MLPADQPPTFLPHTKTSRCGRSFSGKTTENPRGAIPRYGLRPSDSFSVRIAGPKPTAKLPRLPFLSTNRPAAQSPASRPKNRGVPRFVRADNLARFIFIPFASRRPFGHGGYDFAMKHTARTSPPSTSPAVSGNPAYPSLEAREKLVAENEKHPEAVKKIPADTLKKTAAPVSGKPSGADLDVTPPVFPSRETDSRRT